MCLFYADFKHFSARNERYFAGHRQGLVKHPRQPLVNHEK